MVPKSRGAWLTCAMLVVCVLAGLRTPATAAEAGRGDNANVQRPRGNHGLLYGVRLRSVDLAKAKVAEAEGNLPKAQKLATATRFVYVSVVQDGRLVFVSPEKRLGKGQLHLDWADSDLGAYAGLIWDAEGHDVTVRVCLTTDGTRAARNLGAGGALGGAGAGALIGGVLAGVFTGGLGAPAGAAIGAAIGGLVGAGAGVATGLLSKEDCVLMEKVIEKNKAFPLRGKVNKTDKGQLGERWTQSVSFAVTETKEPVKRGELKLQEYYIVRLKEIGLTEYAAKKGEDDPADCRYYVELQCGAKTYTFRNSSAERFRLDTGRPFRPEIYTVFLNTGDETEVRIYEHDRIRDDLVFSSRVARLDGRTWVFQEKVRASDTRGPGSYVVFETFGPLKK